MVARHVTNVFAGRKAAGARMAAAVALVAALAGCETVSDLDPFGVLEESPPATTTAS